MIQDHNNHAYWNACIGLHDKHAFWTLICLKPQDKDEYILSIKRV